MLSVPRHSALLASALTGAVAVGVSLTPATNAAEPGPIHAGNTFGWYPYAQHYEFERWGSPKPLTDEWQSQGGLVRERGGQLTMTASRGRSSTVTLRGAGHRTGRWELRWQGYSLGSGANRYRMSSSLVPADASARRCGPEIAFEDVTLPQSRAHLSISPHPGVAFTATTRTRGESFGGRDHWHTFAVEVTRKRISWFVDAHVIATQTRPDAMVDVPLTVQLHIEATAPGKGDRARLGLDWLRYWTLRRPDSRSVAAPAPVPVASAAPARAC